MVSTLEDIEAIAATRSPEAVEAYFEALGRSVEQGWSYRGNNEEHFPEVAARVLAEMPVPEEVDAVGVLQYLLTRRRLLPQEKLGFGEPPVTVYRSRDFYISVLYWLDGTTSIHQHMFSGAFRVLVGSSIHARYDYFRQEAVNRRMHIGALEFEETELLQRGDVRQIVAGDAFIHALFHLDRPSVTIVVRTQREEGAGPQFEYLRPGLAFDPYYTDETLDRQLRGLRTLHSFAPDDALRSALDLIDVSDLFAGFFVVRVWSGFDNVDHIDDLIEALVRRHGSLAQILSPVMAEKKRQQGIVIRRRLLQDPSHRLFLALLLNLPDRAAMDTILRARFPGQSTAALLGRWLEELNTPVLRGISGLRLSDVELATVQTALARADDGAPANALKLLGSKVMSSPLLEALLPSR